MKIKRKFKTTPNLDMTPMIDMVFLLNIFFLLSSSFVFNSGIKVNLPQSGISETQSEKKFSITLTQENFLFFNTERISLDELDLKFKSISKTAPDSVIIIKADGNVKHSKVVEIMALAKTNHLARIAIATRPKEEITR